MKYIKRLSITTFGSLGFFGLESHFDLKEGGGGSGFSVLYVGRAPMLSNRALSTAGCVCFGVDYYITHYKRSRGIQNYIVTNFSF